MKERGLQASVDVPKAATLDVLPQQGGQLPHGCIDGDYFLSLSLPISSSCSLRPMQLAQNSIQLGGVNGYSTPHSVRKHK